MKVQINGHTWLIEHTALALRLAGFGDTAFIIDRARRSLVVSSEGGDVGLAVERTARAVALLFAPASPVRSPARPRREGRVETVMSGCFRVGLVYPLSLDPQWKRRERK